MRKYVTVKFLAERYDAADRSIWRWVKIGELPPPERIGGATRWDLERIERWDAERAKRSEAEG